MVEAEGLSPEHWVWETLAEKMRRCGRERMREEFGELTPQPVAPEDADFFVYVKLVCGDGAEASMMEWYREGDRWIVAGKVGQLVESGEALWVVLGDADDVEMVRRCREAMEE